MDADRDEAQESALEQATDWLIQLQDTPDDPDVLRRFDAWLAASSCNVTAWSVTGRVAGVIARTPPGYVDHWRPLLEAHRAGCPPPSSSTPRSGQSRIKAWLRERGWSRRRGFAIAAAVAAAGLAFLVMPGTVLRFRADYVTGTAEMRTIDLTDGSTVVLAPGSAIRVAYGNHERHVDLLSGEAFFNIIHDTAKPFRVGIDGVETTDLGTAFDVRRSDDAVSMAVQQGSIRVDYRAASPPVSETLGARQTLHVAWTGAVVHGEEPSSQVAAWRQYQLIARDDPMREVVDRLRPYFAGIIIVASSALDNQPVTGVYNLADPVEALRGIGQAHGASVRRISPWILVVSGG